MPKRKIILITIVIFCAVLFVAGATWALLTAHARPLKNTFTVGNIKLSLVETTGESYPMIPGKTVDKNPRVKVFGGSEDCWLFIEVGKTEYFDDYVAYEMDPEWTRLEGYENVYYRSVERSERDTEFRVLLDDTVTVRDTLTEEKMSEITAPPKMTFKAYAIQSFSISTAAYAWQQILQEVIE